MERICSEPFLKLHAEESTNNDEDNEASIMIARIRDQLFPPAALDPKRWAASAAVQEPDCVSWDDHGLGSAPIDNIRIVNDLDDDTAAGGGAEAEAEIGDELVRSTLETRHLSRRERGSKKHHHHHHHKAQKRDTISASSENVENKKVDAEAEAVVAPLISIRGDTPSTQGVYAINKDEPKISISRPAAVATDNGMKVDDSKVLLHETLGHSESSGESPDQRVLIQGGSSDNADPAKSVENLGKASEGHPVDKDAAKAEGEAAGDDAHTHKGTVLLAAVPILLVMGAIAGFTIYRRYQEKNFNLGGRIDSRDEHSSDGYHQRSNCILLIRLTESNALVLFHNANIEPLFAWNCYDRSAHKKGVADSFRPHIPKHYSLPAPNSNLPPRPRQPQSQLSPALSNFHRPR